MNRSSLLEVRRLRFRIGKKLPQYWNGHCPAKTHIFNAIAILTPGFERLAITSLLPYQAQLSDPLLTAQLKGFIGQESAHGSEFIRFNQVLKAQGYDIKKLEKSNLKRFKGISDRLSTRLHLSLTLAAEHITAVLSDLLLKEEEWLSDADPACAALWRWHAIEEIEHKAVAYDVYYLTGGGYFTRIVGMGWMLAMVGYLLSRNFLYLVKKDHLLFSMKFWIRWLALLWGKPGMMRKLLFPIFRYFSPRFHPWKQNNSALIEKWKMVLEKFI